MTRGGGLTSRADGNHVADFNFAIGHDDPCHQGLDELALSLPGRLLQAVPHALAKLIHAQPEARDLAPAVQMCLELPALGFERLCPALRFAPASLVLLEPHHAGEVGLRQPLDRCPTPTCPRRRASRRAWKSRGSQWPPCARSSARRIASGWVSNRQTSSQTRHSSCSGVRTERERQFSRYEGSDDCLPRQQ